jgi:hypothetical protein
MGWGGGERDQSIAVSMCRNRVILTSLPAIQPAYQPFDPLAHTSVCQSENRSASHTENQLVSQQAAGQKSY